MLVRQPVLCSVLWRGNSVADARILGTGLGGIISYTPSPQQEALKEFGKLERGRIEVHVTDLP